MQDPDDSVTPFMERVDKANSLRYDQQKGST